MRIVIVGGVAAGASAATRARRLSEEAEIIMLERGPDVSFANCGLPYHLGGEIADREKLLVVKPELLARRFRIDVRTRSEVVAIDRARKLVQVRDLAHGQRYDLEYDKLVLAMGAEPLRPPIAGLDLAGVFTLRNLADIDRIKAFVDGGVGSAVVVGAGFIGLEVVENLVRRGVATTLIELQDQVLPVLDREMAAPILDRLRERGVMTRLGRSTTAIERTAIDLEVVLTSGERVATQMVILGVGVRPESKLAAEAGLELGSRGGVKTDGHQRTSDPDILAAGDMVEVTCHVTGRPTMVPLAGPANRQGRIAADVIFGKESRFRGAQGTAIVRVFDLVAATTGLSEKSLRQSGIAYLKSYVHPNQHASYFPAAMPMTIKLLFTPGEGKLLGAQVVGGEGVDNRINVLALALQAGMTVFDLEEVELAYAPQFGSAKDAINMAGFVAANVLKGDCPQVYAEDLPAPGSHTHDRPFLLDVRTPTEFAAGAIPDFVNIPLDDLRGRIGEVPSDRKVIVTCQAGQRGYYATLILKHAGRDAANLAGGYTLYKRTHPQTR